MIYGEAKSPQHCKGSQPLCVCKISDLMDVRNHSSIFPDCVRRFQTHRRELLCSASLTGVHSSDGPFDVIDHENIDGPT